MLPVLAFQRESGEDFVAQLRGTLEGLIGTEREHAGYRELVKVNACAHRARARTNNRQC